MGYTIGLVPVIEGSVPPMKAMYLGFAIAIAIAITAGVILNAMNSSTAESLTASSSVRL